MIEQKRPLTVLVVDDEDIVRESLRDWLTESGYQVATAKDGEEALKSIAAQEFAVAIVDLKLPGKSGIEVLREARANRPELKGILITAYPSVSTAVEAMREGAIDYLPKPLDLNELEKFMDQILGPLQVEIKPEAPTEVIGQPKAAPADQVEEVINNSGKVYLPPCQVACPIGENIQRTNAMMAMLPFDMKEAAAQIINIGDEIYEKNPLFTVCSYVCGLCERDCNYKDQTGAVRRKMLKRFITEYYLSHLSNKQPLPAPTGPKIAVIGGGPGGLMAAHALSKKGYRVTILERGAQLGGALRYIPRYRLPTSIIDGTIDNLIRLSHIDVRCGVNFGNSGKTLTDLVKEGYRAVFIATGTPAPRALTFENQTVNGGELEGVAFGLHLLSDMNQVKSPPQLLKRLFRDKRVIVIGGGNVAFDMARTTRRLGSEVTLVCLECEDKSRRDGIPADLEEIDGATEEGIRIVYSRGVQEITEEDKQFKRIKCPKCTSVFDQTGFNPKFDKKDFVYLEGDILLVTIGQGAERAFFKQEDLLDEKSRLDVDRLTLMSNRRKGVFIGGDARRIGFAAEAMRDGVVAAESIDRYLKGKEMKAGREKEFEKAAIPRLSSYKLQPGIDWTPAQERLNFDIFERTFTLEEAVKEARRCLCCGPCSSCKACVAKGLQIDISPVEVKQELCSGCGVCAPLCNYDAIKIIASDGKKVAVLDALRCKRCGACTAACPSGAISIKRHDAGQMLSQIEEVLL